MDNQASQKTIATEKAEKLQIFGHYTGSQLPQKSSGKLVNDDSISKVEIMRNI